MVVSNIDITCGLCFFKLVNTNTEACLLKQFILKIGTDVIVFGMTCLLLNILVNYKLHMFGGCNVLRLMATHVHTHIVLKVTRHIIV